MSGNASQAAVRRVRAAIQHRQAVSMALGIASHGEARAAAARLRQHGIEDAGEQVGAGLDLEAGGVVAEAKHGVRRRGISGILRGVKWTGFGRRWLRRFLGGESEGTSTDGARTGTDTGAPRGGTRPTVADAAAPLTALTPQDVERIEAARLKRLRKAEKKGDQ